MFAAAVRTRCKGRKELRQAVDVLLRARDEIGEQIEVTDAALLEAAKADSDCRRPMTIPNVGPITSLAFLRFVEDGQNFPKARAVGAYFSVPTRSPFGR